MTQLRQEGWIHHLARHAAACFLTRGDLWISWEEGMKVYFWFGVFSFCSVIFPSGWSWESPAHREHCHGTVEWGSWGCVDGRT